MKSLKLIVCFGLALAMAKSYHSKAKYSKKDYDEHSFKMRQSSVDDIENIDYWYDMGSDELDAAMSATTVHNTRIAKNVIIFVGDGMSIPTLAASRIFKAQYQNGDFERPEKDYLTFERFPHLGHSKTYDIDYQVPDSASTASAMFSGVKTKYFTLGYDSHIDHYDANSMLTANEVSTIMQWAQEAGKDTGVVTTARITHATPGATYAHVFDRDWECDTRFDGPLPPPPGTHDIAWQLVNRSPGNMSKVMLGGGGAAFYPTAERDQLRQNFKPDIAPWECYRSDGVNLANQWLANHGPNSEVVYNREQLLNVDAGQTDYLLGLLGEGHVEFDDRRDAFFDPSLPEMAEKAIEILQKSANGFFLMVEGGRIDHAHHDTWATRALRETMVLDMTVERVMQLLGNELDDTLIIVTADHSHAMSFNGYPRRGMDIRGTTGRLVDDDLPITTLSYANGPAFYQNVVPTPDGQNVTRVDLRTIDEAELFSYDYAKPAMAYKESETHGGDDVAIFARGPMSHLFHTTHDQSFIAHVMGFSACIGPYKDDPRRCL